MGEILRSLAHDAARGRSRLAAHVHVPYDRLQAYLDELAERALVTRGEPPELTPAGRTFLAEFEAWRAALERVGLEDAQPDRR